MSDPEWKQTLLYLPYAVVQDMVRSSGGSGIPEGGVCFINPETFLRCD